MLKEVTFVKKGIKFIKLIITIVTVKVIAIKGFITKPVIIAKAIIAKE